MKQNGTEYLYLGLGGNLPDTLAAMREIYRLCLYEGFCPLVSSLYSSPAIGMEGPDFLNAALRINLQRSVSPWDLLTKTVAWERQNGRTKKSRNGIFFNRIIDIDLLAYGDRILQGPHLSIPHYALHIRPFAFLPLLEISPCWKHPLGISFSHGKNDSTTTLTKVADAKEWVK